MGGAPGVPPLRLHSPWFALWHHFIMSPLPVLPLRFPCLLTRPSQQTPSSKALGAPGPIPAVLWATLALHPTWRAHPEASW